MMFVLARQKFVTLFRFCCNMFVCLFKAMYRNGFNFICNLSLLYVLDYVPYKYSVLLQPQHLYACPSEFQLWQTASRTLTLCRINSLSSSVVYSYYLCYDFNVVFLFLQNEPFFARARAPGWPPVVVVSRSSGGFSEWWVRC